MGFPILVRQHLIYLILSQDPAFQTVIHYFYLFTSLWPGDGIWHCRCRINIGAGSGLCLTASSKYLIQYWLIINEFQWHLPKGILTEDIHEISVNNMSTRMTYLKLQPYLARGNCRIFLAYISSSVYQSLHILSHTSGKSAWNTSFMSTCNSFLSTPNTSRISSPQSLCQTNT